MKIYFKDYLNILQKIRFAEKQGYSLDFSEIETLVKKAFKKTLRIVK